MTRHPLLAGILLAIALFLAIVCTITGVFLPTVAQTLNIGAAPERSWTPRPIATPAPVAMPTATAATVTLPPGLPTPAPGNWAFKPGDVVVNVNDGPVNMRRTPGYKNKAANDRIALVPAGAQLKIIGGPALVDDLIWWYVDWQGRQGWMAQNRVSGAPLLGKK